MNFFPGYLYTGFEGWEVLLMVAGSIILATVVVWLERRRRGSR